MLPESVRSTIESFAQGLGLASDGAPRAHYAFAFEQSGTLTLAPGRDGERVIVSLARPRQTNEDSLLHRAMTLAGPDPSNGQFLHAAVWKDEVVFAVSLPYGAFSLPALDTALQRLLSAQKAVAGGR